MIKRSFDPSKPYPYYRYGRMSDEEQNPRSPDQQFDTVETTKSRCHHHHWIHQWDYRDDGRSGRLIHKRPGFNQMLEDIKTGRIKPGSIILVDTIERWGRAKKLKAIRDEIYKKFGIVVLAANNNFADPTNETGEVIASMEDIRSWSDSAKKAHDVLRGKIDAAKQGKWPGGLSPKGLRLEVHQATRFRRSGREIVDHYSVLVPDEKTVEVPQRIFDLAYDHSWGPDKIAATLNADQDFVARFGKFSRATIAYIMDNPIYGGTLRFNLNATDIEDDCRIIQRNPEDEVIYVEDFCEAIVDKHKVQKVRADIKRRAEARAAILKAKGVVDDNVSCLGCGISVKYSLAGLVRCGCCGATMRASASGAQNEEAASYYYWHCPTTSDGRCENTEYLRGPWLWEVVCDSLKQELFPGIDSVDGPSVAAIEELCDEVRPALKARYQSTRDQRPSNKAELSQIENQLIGWRKSLGNPQLSPRLRQDIERDYDQALERKSQLESEIEDLGVRDANIDAQVTPALLIGRVRRLAELLTGANIPDLNVELSYHIASIEVFPGGRVVMQLNRLGVFSGLVPELCEGTNHGAKSSESDLYRITPRSLPRRRTKAVIGGSPLDRPAGIMEQASITEQWCKVITLQQPPLVYPYQVHAAAIAARRLEGATHAILCLEFKMTPATVRKSLKYAQEELQIELSNVPKKMARADWAKDHAAEVHCMKATGMEMEQLMQHFGKSDTTIRKALKHAKNDLQELDPEKQS